MSILNEENLYENLKSLIALYSRDKMLEYTLEIDIANMPENGFKNLGEIINKNNSLTLEQVRKLYIEYGGLDI